MIKSAYQTCKISDTMENRDLGAWYSGFDHLL